MQWRRVVAAGGSKCFVYPFTHTHTHTRVPLEQVAQLAQLSIMLAEQFAYELPDLLALILACTWYCTWYSTSSVLHGT